MSAPPLLITHKLTQCLQTLCALPSSTGQRGGMRHTADLVARMLSGLDMQVRVVTTDGAPIVLARRAGRSARSLLLYHRYDTAPPGPWREWSHEPFKTVERDGEIYGRGVSEGKGPLAAHIQALHALLDAEGELPCGVCMVVEGDALHGSPFLAAALAEHAELLRADGCLGVAGERDSHGVPLCYTGSKGLLQVRLSVQGATHPLPAGLASSVANPLWRIVWALAQIKGEDEDIRIPGFYDHIDGPTREENALLRAIRIDEPGRKGAWGIDGFLFGMSAAPLMRAEATLPTCNISALVCEPGGEHALIPTSAGAMIDFQLVPHQSPTDVLYMLRRHLGERGFTDVQVEPMPGGYGPLYTSADSFFVQTAAQVGQAVFGTPLNCVPAGPFTLPLRLLADGSGAQALAIGIDRPGNAVYGADERIAIEDLLRHGQLLIELLARFAEAQI